MYDCLTFIEYYKSKKQSLKHIQKLSKNAAPRPSKKKIKTKIDKTKKGLPPY